MLSSPLSSLVRGIGRCLGIYGGLVPQPANAPRRDRGIFTGALLRRGRSAPGARAGRAAARRAVRAADLAGDTAHLAPVQRTLRAPPVRTSAGRAPPAGPQGAVSARMGLPAGTGSTARAASISTSARGAQAAAGAATADLLDHIARSGQGSFLTVIKTFGARAPVGSPSFPMQGPTPSQDFPYIFQSWCCSRGLFQIRGGGGRARLPGQVPGSSRYFERILYPQAASFRALFYLGGVACRGPGRLDPYRAFHPAVRP